MTPSARRRMIIVGVAYLVGHGLLLLLLYASPLGHATGSDTSLSLPWLLGLLRVLDWPTRAVSRLLSVPVFVAFDAGGLPWAPIVNTLFVAAAWILLNRMKRHRDAIATK